MSTQASAQSTSWEKTIGTGGQAFQQGRYEEAEGFFLRAIEQSENFGPEDPRLAASVIGLATIYYVQGKYAEAEPLSKRGAWLQVSIIGRVGSEFDLGPKPNPG